MLPTFNLENVNSSQRFVSISSAVAGAGCVFWHVIKSGNWETKEIEKVGAGDLIIAAGWRAAVRDYLTITLQLWSSGYNIQYTVHRVDTQHGNMNAGHLSTSPQTPGLQRARMESTGLGFYWIQCGEENNHTHFNIDIKYENPLQCQHSLESKDTCWIKT